YAERPTVADVLEERRGTEPHCHLGDGRSPEGTVLGRAPWRALRMRATLRRRRRKEEGTTDEDPCCIGRTDARPGDPREGRAGRVLPELRGGHLGMVHLRGLRDREPGGRRLRVARPLREWHHVGLADPPYTPSAPPQARPRRGDCGIDPPGGGGPTVECQGPFTRWGGYNSVWTGGYITQVDVYLDVAYAKANPDSYPGNLGCLTANSMNISCK